MFSKVEGETVGFAGVMPSREREMAGKDGKTYFKNLDIVSD
jgi:hypothetical protein